jgi:hypothetical protein
MAMDELKTNDKELRLQVFRILLDLTGGNSKRVLQRTMAGEIDKAITEAAIRAWQQAVPPITVSDVENA